MTQAPSEVVDMQLKELHIRVDVKRKEFINLIYTYCKTHLSF